MSVAALAESQAPVVARPEPNFFKAPSTAAPSIPARPAAAPCPAVKADATTNVLHSARPATPGPVSEGLERAWAAATEAQNAVAQETGGAVLSALDSLTVKVAGLVSDMCGRTARQQAALASQQEPVAPAPSIEGNGGARETPQSGSRHVAVPLAAGPPLGAALVPAATPVVGDWFAEPEPPSSRPSATASPVGHHQQQHKNLKQLVRTELSGELVYPSPFETRLLVQGHPPESQLQPPVARLCPPPR